jgi:hypothetical protein
VSGLAGIREVAKAGIALLAGEGRNMEERVPFSEEVVSLLMARLLEKPSHLAGSLLVDLEMMLEHGTTKLGATIVIGGMKKLRGENPILARAIFDLLTTHGYGTVIAAMEGVENAERHATRPSNARRARKAYWARQLRSPKQVVIPQTAHKGELKPLAMRKTVQLALRLATGKSKLGAKALKGAKR